MDSTFKSSFRSFLDSSYIDFIEYGNLFVFPDYGFTVELVPAGTPPPQWSGTGIASASENPPPQGPGAGIASASENPPPQWPGAGIATSAGSPYGGATPYPYPGGIATGNTNPPDATDKVYLYEDRWWSAREMVQERILARLERFRSIFARKCKVISGRGNAAVAELVRDFLHKHHSYSSTKCRYRYALEYEGEIVAVATFSEGRPMVRKIGSMLQNVPKEEQENAEILIFDSYEWVRYASLPGVRVAGGMGRLLKAFIDERYTRIEPGTPLEVMTYSDSEWGNGQVYEKLGFKYAGERAPVEYFVNRKTYIRYPQRLYEKELLAGAHPEDFYTIRNMGSKKFLLQLL